MVDVNTFFSLDSFDTFKVTAYKEYLVVAELLNIRLDENPVTLTAALNDIEVYGNRISSLLHRANGYLDTAEAQRLLPKSKDYTDIDRGKHLAASCAKERLLRDLLDGTINSIKGRLILGSTNLGIIRAEIERGIRS